MIYTIGYQKITLVNLVQIMGKSAGKNIDLLVDVRSKPYSRKADFNQKNLIYVFGKKYLWLGDICGGLTGKATDVCIEKLAQLGKKRNILLMCMENDPLKCHRYSDLSLRLLAMGIQAIHLFDGKEMTTDELKNSS